MALSGPTVFLALEYGGAPPYLMFSTNLSLSRSLSSGGPPGGPQYAPQGWGNAYQPWQPPAPHDPSKSRPLSDAHMQTNMTVTHVQLSILGNQKMHMALI